MAGAARAPAGLPLVERAVEESRHDQRVHRLAGECSAAHIPRWLGEAAVRVLCPPGSLAGVVRSRIGEHWTAQSFRGLLLCSVSMSTLTDSSSAARAASRMARIEVPPVR